MFYVITIFRTCVLVFLGIMLCGFQSANKKYNFFVSEQLFNDKTGVFSIQIIYENLTEIPYCIRVEDFSIHTQSLQLRIYDESDFPLYYIGKRDYLDDISIRQREIAFLIVPPRESVSTEFRLDDIYEIKYNKDYFIEYSLPVTNCLALLEKGIDIPFSGEPFLEGSIDKYTKWSENLKQMYNLYPIWRKHGFFAELRKEKININVRNK